MPKTTSINDIIDNFISSSLIDYDISEDWSYSFRGSSLPTCPRQLMLGQFYKGTRLEKTVSFSTRYAFHVGRAVHALSQETWSRQGLLYGDWICSDTRHCGVKYTNTRLDRGRCIRCGQPANYIEKHLTDDVTGFSGHVDSVVYVPDLDGYVVFELKTRNSNIISKVQTPYDSDLYQVSMYATLLVRTYWLRIVGRCILWIGKPRPKPYKFWYFPDVGSDLADQQFKLKLDLDQKIRDGHVTDVEGLCHLQDDVSSRECPFGGICLSPVRDRLIREEYLDWLKK